MAHELLSEGLAIVHQVHGPLHQDAAALESNLAMVRYSAQDLANAIAHQTRAVVINERVLGLDHHDTAHAYQLLIPPLLLSQPRNYYLITY